MKIVITDYPETLGRDVDFERKILTNGLKDCEVVVYPYDDDRDEFKSIIYDTDVIITAFVNIDRDYIKSAKKLKAVVFHSTGYNFVDYMAACERGIAIIPIEEYCTEEVADHAMSLLLALARNLKGYSRDIEKNNNWKYYGVTPIKRMSGQKLGIFGFGKIGKALAMRAKAFGIEVIVFSPHLTEEEAKRLEVIKADIPYIQEHCSIISNHMNQTDKNYHFFDRNFFEGLKCSPIFINTARGAAVDEMALCSALDAGLVRCAGLDVLEAEHPKLFGNPLLNRDNVIITPHAAFYSEESLQDLRRITCENTVYFMKGEYEKVHHIVNKQYIF